MSAEAAPEAASPLCQPVITRDRNQDKCSGFLTNDDLKHRIRCVYAKFVSDVQPDRLFDFLLQENVITLEQSKDIRYGNHTPQKKCRALLDLLLSTQHPRAFLVVRQALIDENHYILEFIDNQESRSGIHELPDSQKVLLDISEKSLAIEQKYEQEKNAWREEKEQLKNQIQELSAIEHKYKEERKAWSEEKKQLMKQIYEYEIHIRIGKAWSEEKEQHEKKIQELQKAVGPHSEMTCAMKHSLQECRVALLKNLTVSNVFLSVLGINNTVTNEMREIIQREPTSSGKTTKLLDYLLRRPCLSYRTFIFALVYTNQPQLAKQINARLAEEYKAFDIKSERTMTDIVLSFGRL